MDTHTHPNKRPFLGILGYIDTPSDVPPSGALGHQIILRRHAAADALATIEGMGICCSSDWRGHQASAKIGVIERAEIRDATIWIEGYLYARDVPDVVSTIHASSDWGLSFELADCRVEDMRAPIWILTQVTFTGAAILRRNRAAYRLTDFILL